MLQSKNVIQPQNMRDTCSNGTERLYDAYNRTGWLPLTPREMPVRCPHKTSKLSHL